MVNKIYTLIGCFIISLFITQVANAQCAASYTIWQDTLGAPSTYVGNNTCQGSNFLGIDTINYTYTWSWGDGTSTTAPFPSHTYATPGNYVICLYMNATNPAGCNDSICSSQVINKNRTMYSVTILNPFITTQLTELSSTDIKVYPNPCKNSIEIKTNDKEFSGQLYLINIMGQLVKNIVMTAPSMHVDISDLKAGLYQLSLKDMHQIYKSITLIKE